MTTRKQMRQNALDAAMHWHAIQRARALTNDEVTRQALIRLGPVPTTCRRCQVRPPRNFLMVGSGEWLCNECAGVMR